MKQKYLITINNSNYYIKNFNDAELGKFLSKNSSHNCKVEFLCNVEEANGENQKFDNLKDKIINEVEQFVPRSRYNDFVLDFIDHLDNKGLLKTGNPVPSLNNYERKELIKALAYYKDIVGMDFFTYTRIFSKLENGRTTDKGQPIELLSKEEFEDFDKTALITLAKRLNKVINNVNRLMIQSELQK